MKRELLRVDSRHKEDGITLHEKEQRTQTHTHTHTKPIRKITARVHKERRTMRSTESRGTRIAVSKKV
jgi:hypothetical protein